MRKTVHSKDYKALTTLLASARESRNVTQEELAKRLGKHQSFVSKVEGGERRIDVIEFLQICRALRADALTILKHVRDG